MPEQHSSWVSLRCAQLRAEIDPLGAQLSTLQDSSGRDLLWNGDAAVWAGRAPLLFPIVGTLAGGQYRLGSSLYRLPRHGFARNRRFELIAADATEASFRLRADAATLEVYPFRFELDVRFTLDGSALTVIATLRNIDTANMPASFGYHPAFRWPLPYGQPRSSHCIEFETDEPEPVRRLNADGLVSRQRHPTPVGDRRLRLSDALFADDVVIFDAVRSRSVIYGAPGAPRLRVSYPDAPCLGLWTKPGGGFICIEPWHGMSDPEGFSGDFTVKPGVFVVAPGAALPFRMAVERLDEGLAR
jgi:galactose mutarotase-like enzyme